MLGAWSESTFIGSHRHCCVIVGRAGAAELLADHAPSGRALLRAQIDPELGGWEAHARFLEHLERVSVK